MSKTTALVKSAVEQALFTRRRLIPVSLQRVWCTLGRRVAVHIAGVTTVLIEAGIAPSIGSAGDARHNALIESTSELYKDRAD